MSRPKPPPPVSMDDEFARLEAEAARQKRAPAGIKAAANGVSSAAAPPRVLQAVQPPAPQQLGQVAPNGHPAKAPAAVRQPIPPVNVAAQPTTQLPPPASRQEIRPVSAGAESGYDDEAFDDYGSGDFDDEENVEHGVVPPSKAAAQQAVPVAASTFIPPASSQPAAAVRSILKQPQRPVQPIVPAVPLLAESDALSQQPTADGIHRAAANATTGTLSVQSQRPVRPAAGDRHAANQLKLRHQRAVNILREVGRTEESFDIYTQPPLSAYDLYQRSVVERHVHEREVQVRQDFHSTHAQAIDCQTELQSTDVAAQAPEDLYLRTVAATSAHSQLADAAAADGAVHLTHQRMQRFADSAATVCEALLNEAATSSTADDLDDIAESIAATSISSTTLTLNMPAPASGLDLLHCQQRHVTTMLFSPTSPSIIHIAYSPANAADTSASQEQPPLSAFDISTKSLILQYNTRVSVRQPQRILYSDSIVQCLSIVGDDQLLVGGMADGSLAVWALTHAHAGTVQHQRLQDTMTVHRPSYTTYALHDMNHLTGVQSVAVVPARDIFGSDGDGAVSAADLLTSRTSTASAVYVQLLSLDSMGGIALWQCAAIKPASADSTSSADDDLGAAFGSVIMLQKLATINEPTASMSTQLQLRPNDASQFVYTVGGQLQRMCYDNSTIQSQLAPRRYSLQNPLAPHASTRRNSGQISSKAALQSHVDACLCFDFNPAAADLLVAGYDSGSIALYHVDNELPLMTWEAEMSEGSDDGSNGAAQQTSVMSIKWSCDRPSVFYAYSSNGMLQVYDLCRTDRHASELVQLKAANADAKHINLHTLLQCSAAVNTSSTTKEARKPARLAVPHSHIATGIEVHTLTTEFSRPIENECQLLCQQLHLERNAAAAD